MRREILLAILILGLVSPVLAQNNSTNETGLLEKEWEIDYCDNLNEDCEEKDFAFKPYKMVANILVLFLAIGLMMKFYRVYIKGEPF